MGANSKIEWCDHTMNPWIGCTKVSVGPQGACENCYAEVSTPVRAMHIGWGAGKPRHRTSPGTWKLPLKYERNAYAFNAVHGRRQRVFCASLADVFDNEVDPRWRVDLFELIRATPSLDWLLLTKRIGNAKAMLPADWGAGYPNVRLGATIANQPEADRDIHKLLATRASGHFLSCEPLLGEIDLDCIELPREYNITINCAGRFSALTKDHEDRYYSAPASLDWVIVGGESGPSARPFVIGHGKAIVRQCQGAGVPVFVKQLGARPVNREGERCPHITHRKGADISEWPVELRVQQFPRLA